MVSQKDWKMEDGLRWITNNNSGKHWGKYSENYYYYWFQGYKFATCRIFYEHLHWLKNAELEKDFSLKNH